MLKLTLILSAVLYAGLVIFSGEEAVPPAPEAADGSPARAVPAEFPDRLTTADGRVLTIAARFDPADATVDAGGIAQRSTRRPAIATAREDAPEIVTTSASVAERRDIVAVTGSSVNLRAGPSTGDAILTALARGREAEVMGDAGDGWARIRVLDTGVEGFMAARFLAPVN